jgi:hypothetical protein
MQLKLWLLRGLHRSGGLRLGNRHWGRRRRRRYAEVPFDASQAPVKRVNPVSESVQLGLYPGELGLCRLLVLERYPLSHIYRTAGIRLSRTDRIFGLDLNLGFAAIG